MKRHDIAEIAVIVVIAGLIIYFHEPLMRFKCALALFDLRCKM